MSVLDAGDAGRSAVAVTAVAAVTPTATAAAGVVVSSGGCAWVSLSSSSPVRLYSYFLSS